MQVIVQLSNFSRYYPHECGVSNHLRYFVPKEKGLVSQQFVNSLCGDQDQKLTFVSWCKFGDECVGDLFSPYNHMMDFPCVCLSK